MDDPRPVRPRERRPAPPPPLRMKICGLRRAEDAELAIELRAWALGMVLVEGSPRRTRDEEAMEIASVARRRTNLVGVFVDERLDRVVRLAERYEMTHVQLHGTEGPAYAEAVAKRTGCEVIKAVGVRSAEQVRDLGKFHVDYHLLDKPKDDPGPGWNLALARHRVGTAPLIVAGSLTPDTVADVVAKTRPFAVDVASGVESEPGVKDPDLMRAFAAAVEAADFAPALELAAPTPR